MQSSAQIDKALHGPDTPPADLSVRRSLEQPALHFQSNDTRRQFWEKRPKKM